MIKEFRDFIAKGNVMDLAVGIIIGAAFTAIVNSLVADIINPIIGLIIGGVDFSNLYYVMSGTVPEGAGLQTAKDSGAAVFAYGSFITAIINFLIIAFVVFLLVKAVNSIKDRAMRKGEEVPSAPKGPTQEELLTDIRNILASGNSNVPPANAASPTMPAE
ncbi:Large-conductance mechanosensitive channel [Rubellimicrobium mesophilum DSM 19309]|uniref:Large-conductance mechanosensitive channel n=1 Tax=Rubellimicrobium mesophilum DSM 19309 TaxID=442562 RepID=A0A017HJC0_9RHOB|nr:large conductance mechanosensitive channel protein MscL [Rubellimicrobium mesophilum]EYD74557.1 Large-conductance mechanosensitive channel [Rubellimicrobium mesophilum DSM 19309]